MRDQWLGFATSLFLMASGCATAPLPGATGDVSGPLQSIELYTSLPQRDSVYSTATRSRFFVSDRELYVVSFWNLPGPGDYISRAVLRAPSGTIAQESEQRFRTEQRDWGMYHRLGFPWGEEAKSLGGEWRVELYLNDAAVGSRTLVFEPTNIRLRTDARLFIGEVRSDSEAAPGDYMWTQQYSALEAAKASGQLVGRVLREELARRFPDVAGPGPIPEGSGTSLVIIPTVRFSPNPDMSSRLELEITRSQTGTKRKFIFKSTAGIEKAGTGGRVYLSIAAADLAIQAGMSSEVLDFLIHMTNATPE